MNRVVPIICVLMLAGCAQFQVKERSLSYSTTFGDMEDRIVLENIARFIDDRDRIPSMADFKQGQVQGTDNVSLGATLPFSRGLSGTNIVKNPAVFNVGAVQTQSQDNWTYVPVTDVEDLVRTRCLYKYVVVQSEDPVRYRKKDDWTTFASSQCSLGGHTPVFGYAPPFEPWLIVRSSDQAGPLPPGFSEPPSTPLVFLGAFRSYALWGDPKSFHDFQLALLGSIPNTTGSTAAGTSPAPTKAVVDTGQFVLTGVMKSNSESFTAAGQTLTINLTINNTTQMILSNVHIESPRFTPDDKCSRASIAPNGTVDCSASLETMPEDVNKGSIDALITAYATQSDGTGAVRSSAIDVKIPEKGNKTVSTKVSPQIRPPTVQLVVPQGQPTFQSIYPPFSPGKSSGPVAPPLAPPAQ
jgi:hypothetical protein